MNFNMLADFFAGEPDEGLSPSIRGVAESDSDNGEVDIYVGEMEQVYETADLPVYETDDEGNLVYDDEDNPIPLVDDEGNTIYEEQVVLDDDGEPIPVLDEDGNPVFEKVQLIDPDGEPIVEYDADGNPIGQTDPETGETLYLTDDEGNPLPVLDENDEPVYTYTDEGEQVPLYQVVPVEEPQVVTMETAGIVRAGETPVIAMGFGGASAIGAAGWGDALDMTITAIADVADEAQAVATATNQHFFADTSGIHVTEAENDPLTGHNILINSLGILLRSAASHLVSITRSALAFFDGEGNDADNITAQFGKDGARIGKAKEPNVAIGATGVAFYDGGGTRDNHITSRIGAEQSRIGRSYAAHTETGQGGFAVKNGPDTWLAATGDPTGQPEEWNDCETGAAMEIHTLEYGQIDGDMAVYRLYGAFSLPAGGYGLADAVADGIEDGTLDPELFSVGQPGLFTVKTPAGEPEPEVWILTDGELPDLYIKLSDVVRGGLSANGISYDLSKQQTVPEGGSQSNADFQFLESRWDEYTRWPDDPTSTTFSLIPARGMDVAIASAYRKRAGEVNALVPMKQNGVQVSVEGHRHEVGDIDGLDSGLVTGVKGSAEDEYRTGDVDIGAEDIGVLILGNAEINDLWNAAV